MDSIEFMVMQGILMVRESVCQLKAFDLKGEPVYTGFKVIIRPANRCEYEVWKRSKQDGMVESVRFGE